MWSSVPGPFLRAGPSTALVLGPVPSGGVEGRSPPPDRLYLGGGRGPPRRVEPLVAGQRRRPCRGALRRGVRPAARGVRRRRERRGPCPPSRRAVDGSGVGPGEPAAEGPTGGQSP